MTRRELFDIACAVLFIAAFFAAAVVIGDQHFLTGGPKQPMLEHGAGR